MKSKQQTAMEKHYAGEVPAAIINAQKAVIPELNQQCPSIKGAEVVLFHNRRARLKGRTCKKSLADNYARYKHKLIRVKIFLLKKKHLKKAPIVHHHFLAVHQNVLQNSLMHYFI